SLLIEIPQRLDYAAQGSTNRNRTPRKRDPTAQEVEDDPSTPQPVEVRVGNKSERRIEGALGREAKVVQQLLNHREGNSFARPPGCATSGSAGGGSSRVR